MRMAATTTRPERPFNPVSSSTSLLRFLPLTILCISLIYLYSVCKWREEIEIILKKKQYFMFILWMKLSKVI